MACGSKLITYCGRSSIVVDSSHPEFIVRQAFQVEQYIPDFHHVHIDG